VPELFIKIQAKLSPVKDGSKTLEKTFQSSIIVPNSQKRLIPHMAAYQCCGFGSGSGLIRIILSDPDRDRHPGHADPDPAYSDRCQCQAYKKLIKHCKLSKI
jgi:hypothetical protein